MTPRSLARIEKTFAFVEPFYAGRKHHREFEDTQVGFDRTRAERGDARYQPHRWDPREADPLLRSAGKTALRGWTAAADARRGEVDADVVASLRWPGRP